MLPETRVNVVYVVLSPKDNLEFLQLDKNCNVNSDGKEWNRDAGQVSGPEPNCSMLGYKAQYKGSPICTSNVVNQDLRSSVAELQAFLEEDESFSDAAPGGATVVLGPLHLVVLLSIGLGCPFVVAVLAPRA